MTVWISRVADLFILSGIALKATSLIVNGRTSSQIANNTDSSYHQNVINRTEVSQSQRRVWYKYNSQEDCRNDSKESF